MARLFVAAWPSEETVGQLTDIARPAEPGVRWIPEDNWHITLRFIGEAEVDAVVDCLSGAEFPRTVARLGPEIERLDRRQLVIPVDGADTLAESVLTATGELGQRDRRTFWGHLTIARLKPGARSSLRGAAFESQFEIDEIALVASDLQHTGAVYRTVATFATVAAG